MYRAIIIKASSMKPDAKEHIKYATAKKQLKLRCDYIEKNCLMNNSKLCKTKWIEIKVLHKFCSRYEKENEIKYNDEN